MANIVQVGRVENMGGVKYPQTKCVVCRWAVRSNFEIAACPACGAKTVREVVEGEKE